MPSVDVCSPAPSRTHSSASTPAASRSRRTSSSACRRSRSSASPTAPARRRRSASAAGSRRPSSSGRCAGSRSTSRRPSCARRARGSTCRSRWRCWRPRGRSRRRRSAGTRRSASSRSTGGCGRSAACSRPPRARGRPGSRGSSARRSARPRRRWPGSSRCRCTTWRRRLPTCAASGSRLRPTSSRSRPLNGSEPAVPDLADVRGQERARRALELAAAGGHNLLLGGPPGTGKTMLARRLPGILPRLPPDEALEVTRIHSVAGLLPPGRPLVSVPPFRAPHHTASVAAIVGGGSSPRPGEASLAHRGVLFLDELAEFPRNALEALRQPLEDGAISIARVGGRIVFPARFQLVATMNLCPCGARGDPGGRVLVLGGAAGGVPRQALAGAARPLRPRRHGAAAARARARGRRRARARRRSASASPRARAGVGRAAAAVAGGERAAEPRRRAAAALGARAGRGSRAWRERSRCSPARRRSAPAHVAEALSYRSPTELGTP